MNIGILAVDSSYPNLALMKISAWHKARGDNVEWHNGLCHYDKVYAGVEEIYYGTKSYFDSVPCRPILPVFSASILCQPHFQRVPHLAHIFHVEPRIVKSCYAAFHIELILRHAPLLHQLNQTLADGFIQLQVPHLPSL